MGASNKSLTGQDICAIIKECSESKVVKFSYGELEIDFSNAPRNIVPVEDYPVLDTISRDNKIDLHRELDLKDEELAEMKITDPVEFENLMAQQEFE